MRLPFTRPRPDTAMPGDDPVAAARTRARRRLIGALVLLAIGIVGFPLVFDTRPRPVAPDTPIVAAGRVAEGAAPVIDRAPASAPEAAPATPATSATTVPVPAPGTASPRRESTAPAPPVAAVPSTPAAPAQAGAREPAPAGNAAGKAAATTADTKVDTTASKSAAHDTPPAAGKATEAPAKSLPDKVTAKATDAAADRPADAAAKPAAADTRFVVQVGAYTDAGTLRETRARVEKLGLKTFVQVVETPGGKRTRLRVGPYTARDDAVAAASKLKAAGLPGNVLAL